MKNRLGGVAIAYLFEMADMKVKKDSVCRWKWEGTKTENCWTFSLAIKGKSWEKEWIPNGTRIK